MPSQVTYTGKIGPADTITAKVFPDVRTFLMDFDSRTLEMDYYEPPGQQHHAIVDLGGATITVTDSVTANQHTIVVSNT
jgi:hypothetical protein